MSILKDDACENCGWLLGRRDRRFWWEKAADILWWAAWGAFGGALFMHERMLALGFHLVTK